MESEGPFVRSVQGKICMSGVEVGHNIIIISASAAACKQVFITRQIALAPVPVPECAAC